MQLPYSDILFDLDGTLTDPKEGITRSVRHALEQFGIETPNLDTLLPFIGPPLDQSFRTFYGFDAAQARQAIQYYRGYFDERGLYENAVYPGIPELLRDLTTHGARLGVATSKPTIYATRILRHFHLDTYFAQVVGADLALTRADKRLIIADILAMYPQAPRASFVMVGDREHDIRGARANDIASIAVAYGYGSLGELVAATPTTIAANVRALRALLLPG